MDLVVGLPESGGFNAIWVVVDRLTKLRHLVPCQSNCTSEELASLFLQNIWKHHGLPQSIISDQGTQFASRFWRALCDRLGIKIKLSMSFHPQTDGQTERFNAVMEEYLRHYVNYHQDDWVTWLPLCEFAANNATSETTGESPFFANSGRDPRMNFDFHCPVENPNQVRAHEAARTLQRIHDLVRTEMIAAQYRHAEYYDRRRRPAPRFQPGDKVWLDARNIKTTRPARKLDWKRLGPYPILRVISSHAYELELPDDIRIHPVQPVSLLTAVDEDPYPGQHIPPPPAVVVEGEAPEYPVESVDDSRLHHRQLQYRVRWQGWPDLTWEPWFFVNTTEAVRRFHDRYPDKPGPMPEGAEVEELRRRGLDAHSLTGARPLGRGNCHGPLPIVSIGTKELTFEPHSTQDLEALADVDLLWDARCSPACKTSGCVSIGNPEPRHPAPEHPQPQPRSPAQKCLRNPEPGLDPRTLTRSQTDRLGEPSHAGTPLALGNKRQENQPRVGDPGESTRRGPTLGEAGGTLGKAAEELGKADERRR